MENVQQPKDGELHYLEVCCRLIEQKAGNKKIADWTNGDYIILSNALLKQTQVSISSHTLKRIFGKLKTPDRYHPQKATRDALAIYVGFPDWESFVQAHGSDYITTAPLQTRGRRKMLLPVIGLCIVLTGLALYWLLSPSTSNKPVQPGDVSLECENPEGGNPHSAIFTLKSNNKKADGRQYSVDFGDFRPQEAISPGSLLTHYYEMPGRYYAKLFNGNIVLDTMVVYLPSNGWTATATIDRDTVRVFPIEKPLFKAGKLQVSAQDVRDAGVDTNKTFYVHFTNTKPMGISGDNFELEADLITSQLRPGVRCSQVIINLYGNIGQHYFMFIKPGCAHWTVLSLSETRIDGAKNNLSKLGMDLSNGGHVKVRIENRAVSFWLNNNMVYQASYKNAIGPLFGVRISFSGIGALNNLSVKDLASGKIFQDGFAGL